MILTKVKNSILTEYEEKSSLYLAYAQRLASLIQDFLDAENINVHSVSFRRKERDSLSKKIGKKGGSYKELGDITDICGLRIITYFDDDVKLISKILEREFLIDFNNSTDKADSLDPDRFGYLSVHYVVSNDIERNKLTEYKRFNGIKAEIQVRSILQHAWAEIEHDLGYKSRDGIPRTVRRRFSRLAGIFELADQEFRTIRDELSSYSSEVLVNIESSKYSVELDTVSLRAFISNDENIQRIDEYIAEVGYCDFDDVPEDVSKEVARLEFFGMTTIDDVYKSLVDHENEIREFSKIWLSADNGEAEMRGSFDPGISIFYLCYVLAITNNDDGMLINYISRFVGTDENETAEGLAFSLREKYKKVKKY